MPPKNMAGRRTDRPWLRLLVVYGPWLPADGGAPSREARIEALQAGYDNNQEKLKLDNHIAYWAMSKSAYGPWWPRFLEKMNYETGEILRREHPPPFVQAYVALRAGDYNLRMGLAWDNFVFGPWQPQGRYGAPPCVGEGTHHWDGNTQAHDALCAGEFSLRNRLELERLEMLATYRDLMNFTCASGDAGTLLECFQVWTGRRSAASAANEG